MRVPQFRIRKRNDGLPGFHVDFEDYWIFSKHAEAEMIRLVQAYGEDRSRLRREIAAAVQDLVRSYDVYYQDEAPGSTSL